MKYYITSGIILNRKVEPLIYLYIMIIIVIILSLIIFITLFHYKTFYKARAVVDSEDNSCYVRIYMPLDDVKYIVDNNTLYIDKKKYNYKIKSIDKEYLTDNLNTYEVILLDINLPKKYCFQNLNLSLKIIKEDKRIIDYLIRRR